MKLVGLLVFLVGLWASNSSGMTTDSTQLLQKRISGCQQLWDENKLDKAQQCLLQLNSEFPNQVKLLSRLARISYELKNKENCLMFANQSADLNGSESYPMLTALAKKMNESGDQDLALKIMNRLSVSALDSTLKFRLDREKLGMTVNTRMAPTTSSRVVLKNMGPSINTKENEYLPATTLDGEQLLFTRKVKGNEDFFISTKDSVGQWQLAQNMGYPPNTGLPDGGAMPSADGHYLFYTRCDMPSPNGIERGGCDIAFSFREDSVWSAPQYFGYTINTTAYEGQPCLSSDNNDLYFVSTRPGGFGGKDIWVSHFVDRYWSKPENLGPTINTSDDETSPFIHPDNETFYFSSSGHPGLGSTDLFLSRKNKDGTWKEPINLGYPINTAGFDGSIYVNAKGNVGYCASDRQDTQGGLDIYSFSLYPAIQPKPTLCLTGQVTDKFTDKTIKKAAIEIIDQRTKEMVIQVQSNAGDGSFAIPLHVGRTYQLKISHPQYRTLYKKLTVVDSMPDNYYYKIRLRQPGIIDTLFTGSLVSNSDFQTLDSTSTVRLDSLYEAYSSWSEDSAILNVLVKANYYSGDSLADPAFAQHLKNAQQQVAILEDYFRKKKQPCHIVMTALDMIIYNDDERKLHDMEIEVIESY
jgi:hypothetical protein